MNVVKLRDNRFDDNAPLFRYEREGRRFVSEESVELPSQKVSEEVRAILDKFSGHSLAKLVERGDGAVVDLTQTRHLNESERGKLCFFNLKGTDDG